MLKRCWLDQTTIQQRRLFCQNSGGCGSTFIVKLLSENGIERVFHEKDPDLLEIGLQHYERRIAQKRIVRLLRYTRHNAFFEANNRLFSLTKELAVAFPNAEFIHLHRDGVASVRSAMSKPDIANYLNNNVRFQGTLAGVRSDNPFVRFCHHWANMNRRIHDDFRHVEKVGFKTCTLRFEDLVGGNLTKLEQFLQSEISQSCSPVNVGRVGMSGKFPDYSNWSLEQKRAFNEICGPVMDSLGR